MPGQMDLFGDCDVPELSGLPLTAVAAAVKAAVWTGFSLVGVPPLSARNYEAVMAALETLMVGEAVSVDQKRLLAGMPGWPGLEAWAVARDPRTFMRSIALTQHARRLRGAGIEVTNDAELTAYYTPASVIEAIWRALQGYGFTGGNVLEPSAGTGRFLGYCPVALRAASKFVVVEVDPASAKIAEAVYGEHERIICAGFQDCVLPAQFDVAVGNVPFGNFALYDKEVGGGRALVHDFIITKSLRKLRPGGVALFVTSAGTMDKQNANERRKMSALADFCGAVRLPNTTFKEEGVSVLTDILVFQRRSEHAHATRATPEQWIETVDGPSGLPLNQYFARNPAQVLGELGTASSQYGKCRLQVQGAAPTGDELAAALGAIPVKFAVGEAIAPIELKPVADEGMPEGSFQIINGELMVVESGLLSTAPAMHGKRAARIRSMLAVRDVLRSLLGLQSSLTATDEAVEAARAELNARYDAHHATLGAISARDNVSAMDEDPSFPLLLSLEVWNEEVESFAKAPIFSRRTTWPTPPAARPTNVADAVACSLAERGGIDVQWISSALGRSKAEVRLELLSLPSVFLDPATDAPVHVESYLSGNVRAKLVEARAAVETENAYVRNVTALLEVVPADIPADAIVASLGQPWIPVDWVVQWARAEEQATVRVNHTQANATWMVKGHNGQGTGRVSFTDLLAGVLNQVPPKVYDRLDDGRSVLNADATLAAQARAEQLQESFVRWLRADPDRAEEMQRLYNERVNCMAPRNYDGSHLTFPGMSGVYSPRPTQRNAVWRGLMLEPVLFDHFVGAGKTLTLCALAMELRRMGLAQKPLIVVANKTLPAFTAEFLRIYPAAKVLMMGRDDMEKSARRRFVAKVATGDWDAVIMAQSVFDRITVRQETVKAYAEELASGIEAAAASCDDSSVERRLRQQAISLQQKVEALYAGTRKDDHILLEDLGVDYLAVDEAHAYKNLFVQTKMSGVAGVATSESQRALSMLLKVRHIHVRRGGVKGVAFATATPITNTLTEVFVLQKYLRPDTLEQMGIDHFDAWAAMFGRVANEVEIAPDGSGFRAKDRFCQFQNVPELSRICAQFWDTVFPEDIPGLKRPDMESGRPIVVDVAPSEAQVAYVRGLVERADAVRNRRVKPNEDNMLAIVSDGAKCAMDLRLFDAEIPDHAGSKINACVRNVFEIWAKGREQRHTQIVFSDLGVHDKNGFSVYRDIRAKLVRRGIPECEIAFAQDYNTDAKTAQLDRKVNAGDIRVVLGSTQVLGIGRNVQRRLRAMHHLDVPYRADEVEQRDGRGIRQGNTCAEVAIFRYVTAGTFDAYKWQTVERKAKFTAQFRRHNGTDRVIEDLDAGVLSYAEVKALASGNPLAREQVMLQTQERRLRARVLDVASRVRQAKQDLDWLTVQRQKSRAAAGLVEAAVRECVLADGESVACRSKTGAPVSLSDWLQEARVTAAYLRLEHGRSPVPVGRYGGMLVWAVANGHGFTMRPAALVDMDAVESMRVYAYAEDSIAAAFAETYKSASTLPAQIQAAVQRIEQRFDSVSSQLPSLMAEQERLVAEFDQATERLAELDRQISAQVVTT